MLQVARLIGAAGSGKTTELLRLMEGALPSVGGDPNAIGLLSFTVAARQEAAERAAASWNVPVESLTRQGWIRTGHSVCYRQLGIAAGQMVTDSKADLQWLANVFGVRIQTTLDDESGRQAYIGDDRVAWSLNAWSLHRVTLKPLDEIVRWMRKASDGDGQDLAEVVAVAEKYESAKRLDDRCDFTDLLLRYAGYSCSPKHGISRVTPEGELPPVKVWLFDEQQDASPLLDAVCKRLVSGPDVRWCYVVGDPFQCQPAGTPVLTAAGYKPIEDLDPETDWLVAFNKKEGRFYGTGGGVRFRKAWRDVDSGDLFEVRFADGTSSICTSNHRWLVRTNRRTAYATYLMRKGTRWRIGTVQMFANSSSAAKKKNGEFRLKMRMNQEAADAIWILRVCDTDREARMYEQIVSCRFGIPQVTFRPPCGCKNNLDAEFIDTVFNDLGDLTASGLKCLEAHGLEAAFPFTAKADRSKNGSKACRFIQAPNLLPGIHVVPKLKEGFLDRKAGKPRGARGIGKEADWIEVESIRRLAPGETVRVYSLEVEKHHTYVTTNGIVTGNSIYGFAGSSSECFLAWPAQKQRIMPKSYRCPAPILAMGEECLKRMHPSGGYFDRGVSPADHAGEIRQADDLQDVEISGDEDWLLLARTNYQATRLAGYLASHGIPFRSTKSQSEPTARMIGMAALWKLENGETISGREWSRAVDLLPSRSADKAEMLARGSKKRWKDEDEQRRWDAIFHEDLKAIGATDQLVAAIGSGDWVKLVDHGLKWRTAAKRWGVERAMLPRVRVGTIHSAKGMEAENVLLWTTTSARVEQSSREEMQYNEECRLAYVGVTRAKRSLHIVTEAGRMTPRMKGLE